MYSIFKGVISTKNYDLSDILKKIDTKWIDGTITESQRAELIDLARNNALAGNSVDLLSKMVDLEKRISDIEKKLSTNADVDDSTESDTVTAPDFVVGGWYYNGDLITYNGVVYRCTAPDGTVCTWSPDDYPAYWEIYVSEEPLTL